MCAEGNDDHTDLLATAEQIGRYVVIPISPERRGNPEVMFHLLPHYQEAALYEFGRYWPDIRSADITWQMVPCGCHTVCFRRAETIRPGVDPW